MIKIIESSDLVCHWSEKVKSIRRNSHRDTLSTIKILDNYGMLINAKGTVRLLYFDSFLKTPVLMDVDEVLEFIDVMATKENKRIGCNERVDILLNIICKIAGLNFISDLKAFPADSYIVRFINRKKYHNEWKCILDYLKA
ncbi:hypothetical protein [Amedibacillus sp. YH-ame10]